MRRRAEARARAVYPKPGDVSHRGTDGGLPGTERGRGWVTRGVVRAVRVVVQRTYCSRPSAISVYFDVLLYPFVVYPAEGPYLTVRHARGWAANNVTALMLASDVGVRVRGV